MEMRPSDLRGILSYVPRFKGETFVLSLDSEVLTEAYFENVLQDISVLRSLNIQVVLVYGLGVEMKRLGGEMGHECSSLDGAGVTDEGTMRLAVLAASQGSHKLLSGLSQMDERAGVMNAVVAHPYGIIDGVDWEFTGRVERVDVEFLRKSLGMGVIPIISPVAFDGAGEAYRVSSDGVALEVAEALNASKLMFVWRSNGVDGGGSLATQFSVKEVAEYLEVHRGELDRQLAWKLEHGRRACRNGVKRVHVIDGRDEDALLNEIFSNEGVGTMIYANEYEAIRGAVRQDVHGIMRLVRESVEMQELLPRGREDIENRLEDWYVFEIDGNLTGCVMLRIYDGEVRVGELGSLFVSDAHENQGIGRKLMAFSEEQARKSGVKRLLALSTQAFNYFRQKGGFEVGGVDDLPDDRRVAYLESQRNSKILVKDL